MHPVAFSIPFPFFEHPLEIRWYGIMMASSMLLGAWISALLLKRIGRKGDFVWDGLFFIILFGVVGARLVYVLTNPQMYFGAGAEWWRVIAVWQGGLSFHGGIIGGLVTAYYYFRRVGIPFIEVMDSFAPGVSLGVVLVRIGNYMNGDILGYKWDGPWAMNFPFDEYHINNAQEIILRHPTELYGLLVGVICLVLSIVLWIETYETKRFPTGAAYMGFILSYSLVRSVIEEPFRDVPLPWKVVDPKVYGYGLFTTTQIVSILLIIVALWGFTQLRTWEKRRALAPAPAAVEPGAPLASAGPVVRGSRQVKRAAQREAAKHKK